MDLAQLQLENAELLEILQSRNRKVGTNITNNIKNKTPQYQSPNILDNHMSNNIFSGDRRKGRNIKYSSKKEPKKTKT